MPIKNSVLEAPTSKLEEQRVSDYDFDQEMPQSQTVDQSTP